MHRQLSNDNNIAVTSCRYLLKSDSMVNAFLNVVDDDVIEDGYSIEKFSYILNF